MPHDPLQSAKGESSSEDVPRSSSGRTSSSRPGDSSRRTTSRQNYAPAQFYSTPGPNPRDGYQSTQSYPQHFAPPTPAGGMYGQRSGYMAQYTMSQQPHPQAMQPSSGFGYPPQSFSHPGRPGPEGGIITPMLSIPYTSTPMAPSIHATAPIYPFHQRPSPEAHGSTQTPYPTHSDSPSSHVPFTDPSNDPSPPSNTTPPIHTPAPPTSGTLFQPGPYPSPSGISHFTYSPHSFAPTTPSIYTTSYPQNLNPYGQPFFAPQTSEEGKGTWWYLPAGVPSSSAPFESHQGPYSSPYPVGYPVAQYDPYMNVPSSNSSMFSTSPTQRGPGQGPPSAPPPRTPSGSTLPDTHRHRFPQPPPPSAPITSPVLSALRSQLVDSKQSDPASPTQSSSRLGHRPYHPNPSSHRSEWVMWVGNVPSDATHDELWRFFNQEPPSRAPPAVSALLPSNLLASPEDDDVWGGVLSVFLISRSNCAFVNFESQNHLERAVLHFNSKPLRPNDPRCPRLVCRVRGREDDLKAGVGGQRGMGMHTRWVKQHEKERDHHYRQDAEDSSEPPPSASSQAGPSTSSADSPSHGRDDSPRSGPKHAGSSGSYASTNSSFLSKNFPQRYFIMKSLTQRDLDISLETGVWATQTHNEPVLDQAFRTSKEVFLIFGANKSGEFFGYAQMDGPINKGDHHVAWASRTDSSMSPLQTIGSPIHTHSRVTQPEVIPEEEVPSSSRKLPRGQLFSPSEHRMAANSPAALTPGEEQILESVESDSRADLKRPTRPHDLPSAPAEMDSPHRKLTYPDNPREAGTLDFPVRAAKHGRSVDMHTLHLDGEAPHRAVREQQARSSAMRKGIDTGDGVLRRDTILPAEEQADGDPASHPPPQATGDESKTRELGEESWGTPFKIKWIRTDRLPFTRTRHLRNPWNHDREVKVSRDGTEIEPSVGADLLAMWDNLNNDPPPSGPPPSTRRGPRSSQKPGASGAHIHTPVHPRSFGSG